MKVLWFEISVPSNYQSTGNVLGGWQDSLERIVKNDKNIELYIAFEAPVGSEKKVIDGVTYIPLCTHYNWFEKQMSYYSWSINEDKLMPLCLAAVEEVKPDIIHVFGNEWPFGLIAEHTSIPVTLHIQGSITPYNNALYPPQYSFRDFTKAAGLNLIKQYHLWQNRIKARTRLAMEKRVWKSVRHYMGRTSWDLALCNTIGIRSSYHHVDEALRDMFIGSEHLWHPKEDKVIRLFTVGIHNYWKGPDMLLKTAAVLTEMGMEFEWRVAGQMHYSIKEITEKKEKLSFDDYNIKFLGYVGPEELIEQLTQSTMYVHTAYIENSPNSICEAQVLGVPVVSTYVGGIDTLVRNHIDGVLVPANDPWRMADAIVALAQDRERMMEYSRNTRQHALERHDKNTILNQLLTCYKELISNGI